MGIQNGAGSADDFLFESLQVRGIAAKGCDLSLEAFRNIVVSRLVASSQAYFKAGIALFLHPGLNFLVTGEGGSEIQLAAKGGAQDVLGIQAAEHTHVPGGLSEDFVPAPVVLHFEFHHKVHPSFYGTVPVFGITAVAGLSAEVQAIGEGAFGGAHWDVLRRLSYDKQGSAESAAEGFGPEGARLFSA